MLKGGIFPQGVYLLGKYGSGIPDLVTVSCGVGTGGPNGSVSSPPVGHDQQWSGTQSVGPGDSTQRRQTR